MKLAISVDVGQDDQLILAQQLGVEQVFVVTGDWRADFLAALVHRVDKAGLTLGGCAGLEYVQGAAGSVSRPQTPATVEDLCRAIADAGRLKIPQITMGWKTSLRSGHGEIQTLVRAAAAAGVRLAWLSGGSGASGDGAAATDLTSLLAASSSAVHGLELSLESCESTAAALETIDAAGDRIFSVQLANHSGTQRRPCPLDRGDLAIPAVLRALANRSYAGSIRAVRGPEMVDDTAWGHKRRAFDLGYVRAALQALAIGAPPRR